MIDETHTICVGPGGATRAWGLDPDFFVIGKPIAGGLPAAAFGMTAALAAQLAVNQLGARAEYWFSRPPSNGAEAAAAVDEELDSFMHLWALNRQILLTPFHNVALMSPATTADDVDAHTEVFAAAVGALT